MRTTKHKLGYRLVLCLVVLMLFFSDSSDEQALGFSACYNKSNKNVGTYVETLHVSVPHFYLGISSRNI